MTLKPDPEYMFFMGVFSRVDIFSKVVARQLFILALLAISITSYATEDEDLELIPASFNYNDDFSSGLRLHQSRPTLSSEEVYRRTQSVLKYYKSPQQPTGQEELSQFSGQQNSTNIEAQLKYFDVNEMFTKLYTLSNSSLDGFDDIDGKSHLNFSVPLAVNAASYHIPLQGTRAQPLLGLRVAIDPGHMGEKYWDDMTGKYVKDAKGNYLSEGEMALQTSLLLQSELKKLGAEVVLTRSGMTPVTTMPYNDLPIEEFAKTEIAEQIFSPWFQNLLTSGTGAALFKAFDLSPERKKLWSANSRYNYFILKEDLWARANKINAFNPDIVLIIHFDVAPNKGDGHVLNAKAPNHAKAYVSGAFYNIEYGSRKTRKLFAKKLLNQTQWEQSILLSRKILDQFHSQMGLNYPTASESSVPVAPGIFSRNLTLPRYVDAPAVSYLECLFYNKPEEFYAFTNTKYNMTINGKNYPYSDRLNQVVNSIKLGVLNYVAQSYIHHN